MWRFILLLLPAALVAQEPPQPVVLQNTGKPMLVEYACNDEDMHWAGMSCAEDDPCAIYLEIASVEAAGNRLFAAGNIHTSSTTLYSVLLGSEDSGKTWIESHARLRGSGFERIQFADFEAGWVGGHILHPLARDPFLMITSDGGRTWRQQPVFPESRSGTMQQFWFDSRKAGSLLIESGDSGKHELYESANGGESWMVREVSDRPIRLKKAPAANEDWRIRAEASSKSFRIEKRQGERWNAVASFLIPIAQCRPSKPKEAAPPPEEPERPEAALSNPPPAPARPKPPSLKKPPR